MTNQPETRAESVAAKLATHLYHCGAILVKGTCKCERYEYAQHADGFDTCLCGHTRWSHSREERETPEKV